MVVRTAHGRYRLEERFNPRRFRIHDLKWGGWVEADGVAPVRCGRNLEANGRLTDSHGLKASDGCECWFSMDPIVEIQP